MKRFFWALLSIFTLVNVGNIWACNLTVRVTEFPPFFSKSASGKWTGMGVELAEALLMESQCTFTFEDIPFKRALKLIEKGDVDMIIGVSSNDERKKYMHFIGPAYDETAILVIRKNVNLEINSLDDFKKLPGQVGRTSGTYRGKVFEDKFNSDKEFANIFEVAPSVEINRNKLISGRIVGFINALYSERYALNINPEYNENFSIHPYVIYQNWVYFGFSKQSVSKKTLLQLENGYTRAKEKGTFAEIINRYQ